MISKRFSGYKWESHAFVKEVADVLLETADWQALMSKASIIRGEDCVLTSEYTTGGRNLIRILKFASGLRWIARLRLHRRAEENNLLLREVHCMELIQDRTSIRIPKIYAYGTSEEVGAAYMLMECLPANVAMDVNRAFIPKQFKSHFFKQVAHVQASVTTLQFPKIGSLIRSDSGYEIGPLPDLGGLFSKASEYLEAWAANAKFCRSNEEIIRCCGPWGDEIVVSVAAFPSLIREMAKQPLFRNEGPFPLVHTDFGLHNIVVDDVYDVLGTIDWEHAFVAPWQVVRFPMFLGMTPSQMDLPSNWDENGIPTRESDKEMMKDRAEYLHALQEYGGELSDVLKNERLQAISEAIYLYEEGKMGLYSRMFS